MRTREAERLAAEQERQHKDQERIEADRLADLGQLRVDQEQQRMYQEGACGGGVVG